MLTEGSEHSREIFAPGALPIEMECASLTGTAFDGHTDDRLVALARRGEPRAFEEIVRRYRPTLVRFAGGFVSNGRAEDVVQEALIRSHKALVESDAEIQLRPWLFRIVHNGAISELRATRPYEQLDETINGVPQPPDIVERGEKLGFVIKELKALPENQRTALVKSELEGTSHDEIAAELGTTPGGVSQLIFRARTSLRSAVGLLSPVPLLGWIPRALGIEGSSAVGAGGAAGGATAAVIGSSSAKIGATVAAAALAIGSGTALHGGQAPTKDNNKPGHVAIETSGTESAATNAVSGDPAASGVVAGGGAQDPRLAGASSTATSTDPSHATPSGDTAASSAGDSDSPSGAGGSRTGSGERSPAPSESAPSGDQSHTAPRQASSPPAPRPQPRPSSGSQLGGGSHTNQQPPPPSATQTQQPPPPRPSGSSPEAHASSTGEYSGLPPLDGGGSEPHPH